MGAVHEAITTRGKGVALLEDFERSEVEAAAAYLSAEDNSTGFLHSGWCQAALPHKKLEDNAGWQTRSERITLVVEPGMKPGPAGSPIHVGVPYGSRARVILFYLQSQAVKTQSREIELGGSLREWLTRMGIAHGGKSFEMVREQADRISRCKLSFHMPVNNGTGLINQSIVDTAMFMDMDDDAQGSLFVERAQLSEGFFRQLQKHSVPLEEAAIKAISNNSQALDLYAWLAYRLRSIQRPTPVSWRALKEQFGGSFARMDHFRLRFIPNLKLAMAVYPDAKIDVDTAGLILHQSKPPVAPKVKGTTVSSATPLMGSPAPGLLTDAG